MDSPDLSLGAERAEPGSVPGSNRAKGLLAVAVVVAVIVAASLVAYHERHDFVTSVKRVGVGAAAASLFFGSVAVLATMAEWRAVLRGLGVAIPFAPASRVFFISQLGKYLPGSVWPVVMQMEAGKSYGAGRRKMLAANFITIADNCVVGLLVAALVLPFYDPAALHRYWWVLLGVPPLLLLLHPRSIPWLLDRLFALARRPPLNEPVQPRALMEASGYSLVGWAAMGAHLGILASAVGPGHLSTWVVCFSAMALAVPAGVLFIPAPAGAGIREVVLVFVLTSVLASGAALAVAVASRVVLVATDLLLALIASVMPRLGATERPGSAPSS